MKTTISGLFPDRETANHAITDLKAAGFNASRMNAEDFERPEYYKHQMPQGATLVTVDADGRADEARAIIRRTGGQDLDQVAAGEAAVPTAFEGDTGGGVAAPAQERQALREKQQDELTPFAAEQRAQGRSVGGELNNTGAGPE